jgi:DNA-binding SARP family transcriptional activator/tetratricopeptide (TPR) repeat protein
VLLHAGDGRALVGAVTGASGAGASVAVLGPLAIGVDGREVVVAGFRRRALLARLALSGGEPVPADRLAGDLWEDEPARLSLPTLRTYVAKLRHLLPGGAATLGSAPGGYVLALAPDALDVARFERAVASAARAVSPADVERVLLPTLAEWRGGAYEEFAHLRWAGPEATRLDELRLTAQERLFDAQLALGRHADLVPTLCSLAAAHPLRERLQVQLATALYRCDRQAEALATQRRAREALVEGLGLQPSPELADLERRILQQDPALAPPSDFGRGVQGPGRAPVLPRPLRRRRGDATFVGRSEDLARLEAALDAVCTDGARLIMVRGEPGIGKSRLVAEFAAWALRRGATVLYGRCDEGAGAPYQPFVGALRELASHVPHDTLGARLGDDPGALATLVPEMAAHLPASGLAAAAGPEAQRLRLFEAVTGWLRATSAQRPLVLVLEDIHWATASTVMLTRHAVRALGDRPVVVATTARSTAPDASALAARLVADLHQDGRVDVVDLVGLLPEAVDALIEAEQGPGPAERRGFLHAATAGNPFLLIELLRHGGSRDGELPAAIRDVLGARIDRLPDPVRDAVRVAAVVGVEFDVPEVAATLGRDDDDTVTALDDAVAAGLLHETDGAVGRYAFVHGIVQVAVVEGQGPTRRASVHAAVARALETGDRRADKADKVAHHWHQAGADHTGRAAEWSRRAGRQALAQLAYDDAVHRLSTALAAGAGQGPAWRSHALLDLAAAHAGLGDAAAGREALLEAAALARAAGDPVTLARAALGSSMGGRGVPGWIADATRVDLLAEARAALPEDEHVLRIRVTGELALASHRPEDRTRRQLLAQEAVAMAGEHGDGEALVASVPASRIAYWHPLDTPTRMEHARAGLRAAEALEDHRAIADALDWVAADAYELGDRTSFTDAVTRQRGLARDGAVALWWRACVWDAVVATTAGDLTAAEGHATGALASWDGEPAPDALEAFGAQLCMIRLLQGRAAEVVELADQAVDRAPDNAGMLGPRALVLAAAGRLDEATKLVAWLARDGLDRVPQDSQWLLNLVALAEASVRVGDPGAMEACAAALGPLADRFAALAGPGVVWGSVAHQLGLVALAQGRPAEAVAHLERACELEEAFGARPWLARSRARLAEARRASA